MSLAPYRHVLALPGVRSLTVLMLLARIPTTASGMVLTLYVVLGMHEGYAAAGLVTTFTTIGVSLGSPLMGRLVDRRGVRHAVLLACAAVALFWAVVVLLPYPALLVAAMLAGVLQLPVFGLGRQALTALVPEAQRRTAFSLDSVSVEVSYAVGPAAGVLVATMASPTVAVAVTGAALLGSGFALYRLDPPVRSEAEQRAAGARPARRVWFTPALFGVLIVSTGATLVLSGTEVGLVASLRQAGELGLTGLVFAAWCAASICGGLVHGAVRRSLPPVALMALLGVLTIPVGIAHQWWALALVLVPAGALCAPTIAATGEAVSRLAPPQVRGEAMGLHGSALTVGVAIGAPLAGAVIDQHTPAWGYAVAGCIGLLVAAAGSLAGRRPPQLAAERTPEYAAATAG